MIALFINPFLKRQIDDDYIITKIIKDMMHYFPAE